MSKLNFLFLFFLFLNGSQSSFAQAFWKAPQTNKKVKEIVEWHRPDLKMLGVKKAISGFDKKGNLIYHHAVAKPLKTKNSYQYDAQNRIKEKVEYFEGIKHVTHYSYAGNLEVSEHRFHGKTYRTCDYFKNKKRVEQKVFVKGGELPNVYHLLRRSQFFYHKNDSLKSEQITYYGVRGSKKGKPVSKEKTLHHYNSGSKLKSHMEFFDLDNSLRKERYFSYNSKGQVTQIIDYFRLENKVEIIEFLYQKGIIWQKIIQKEDQKNVLIYHNGRPIRLRSYIGEKINHVVDYGYTYY